MKRKNIYKTQVIAALLFCINLVLGVYNVTAQNSTGFMVDRDLFLATDRTTLLSENMQVKTIAETPVLQFTTSNSDIAPGGTGTFVVTLDSRGDDSIRGYSFDIQYDASVIDSNSFVLNWNGNGTSQDEVKTIFVQKNGVVHVIVINSTDTKKSEGGSKSKSQVVNILVDFKLLPVDNISGLTLVQVQNSSVKFFNNTSKQLPNLNNQINITGKLIAEQNQNYSSVDNTVNVYPNPVTPSESYITIDLGAQTSNHITICDISGKLVKVLTGNNSGNVKIEVDNLQGSVYIITIYTQGGAIVKKFVKIS